MVLPRIKSKLIPLLFVQTNELTTALGAANIALYAAVYTPLKQISIANTWVGAVVGAIPPLMGWASASGQLEVGSAVLASTLFFWQMPHFLALAWLCKEDYIKGGFKMLSGIDANGKRTALAALRHNLYLLPVGLLACMAGVTSEAFAWEATAMTAFLGYQSTKFVANPSQASARKLFKSSLLYLPLFMLGMIIHRQPNQHNIDIAVLRQRLEEAVSGVSLPGAAERALGAVTTISSIGSSLADNVTGMRCPSKVHCDSTDELSVEAGHVEEECQDPECPVHAAGQRAKQLKQ